MNSIQTENCDEPLASKLAYPITKFLSWGLLLILLGMEILQFLSKVLTSEKREYLTRQNMTEVALLAATFSFFVLQHKEQEISPKSGLQEHLLGWSLFLAWSNLSIFLAKFDLFGQSIHLSWHVLNNVAMSMLVYVPTIFAFSLSLHCFLKRNAVFEGPGSSLMKTLSMMLGEYDLEDNFIYDQVKEKEGSNISVQVFSFSYSGL